MKHYELKNKLFFVSGNAAVIDSYVVCVCSAPYEYFVPYAYGTSHMRILIWDVHTRMGRPIVPYKYIFMDFIAMIFTGLCSVLQLRIVHSMHALVMQ